jgi:hypothetical protein
MFSEVTLGGGGGGKIFRFIFHYVARAFVLIFMQRKERK